MVLLIKVNIRVETYDRMNPVISGIWSHMPGERGSLWVFCFRM